MMLRRVAVALAVVFGLSVWSWSRSDASPAPHSHTDVRVVNSQEAAGGTHDEAFHRYQTNQSRHWRHVMIGR